MTKEEIGELVEQALEEINSLRDPGNSIPMNGDTKLVGLGGTLDSMETVNLILILESSVAKKTGRKVDLITPEVFRGKKRQLESVDSLVAHIFAVCN